MKDKRYAALKSYIESGELKTFTEAFDIVPKSVFVRDTGINYVRLTAKIKSPDKFTVKDIVIISNLIGIDSRKLYNLIASAIEKKSKR